jgi:mono/diheme cytochrome c family protein
MRKLIGGCRLAVLAMVSLSACSSVRDPAVQDPSRPAAESRESAPAAGELPPGVTTEMVAQGQQLYGVVCVACHGAAGVGGPLGPALNDQQWIHIGGEYEEIVEITRTGVPRPQQYPAPMPRLGGANFNEDQQRALAAYVYALSRGRI